MSFTVYPREPELSARTLSESERKHIKGISLKQAALIVIAMAIAVGGLFLLIGVAIVPSVASIVGYVGVALGLVFGLLLATAVHMLLRTFRIRKKTKEKTDKAIAACESEAKSLESRMNDIYNSSARLARELPGRIDDAQSWLPHAEEEFYANAFGSYWDAIENSALILHEVQGTINKLIQDSFVYRDRLSDREHNFPAFPIAERSLPDPTSVATNLRLIARLGETNFEFYNILEHRRTRKTLKEGFGSLKRAIHDLESTIEFSFGQLQDCFSHEITMLADRQIETQENFQEVLEVEHKMDRTALSEFKKSNEKQLSKVDKKLDNIQRGKKPQLFE